MKKACQSIYIYDIYIYHIKNYSFFFQSLTTEIKGRFKVKVGKTIIKYAKKIRYRFQRVYAKMQGIEHYIPAYQQKQKP